MLFEGRDFTRGFQITEEEILNTKFNIIHEELIITLSPQLSCTWIIMGLKIPRCFSTISFPVFISSTLGGYYVCWGVLCVE